MKLGAFSVSLTVKDIHVSKDFYHKLGFEEVGVDINQKWLILRNGTVTIGLFQGMFEKNVMTFNPGWDSNANPLTSFEDVRTLQKKLKSQKVELTTTADESTKGPGSFMIVDPDGNPILFDQHV